MTQGDSEIVGLEALEILDSRGWPTLEVSVRLKGGAFGKAAVPSGKSTGRHEAVELRDLDKARYQGRGVRQAVRLIETEVQNRVLGHRAYEQAELDGLLCQLDGTSQKSRLGANSILAVSLATCQAAASLDKVPLFRYLGGKKACRLPVPFLNILNGGVHADNHLDIQEFMLVPLGLPTFSEALRAGVEIFHKLEDILKKRGHSTALGDEGGFAPQLQGTEEAFAYLVEAIEKAHYKVGEQVALAVDVAASELLRQLKQQVPLRRANALLSRSGSLLRKAQLCLAACVHRRRPRPRRLRSLAALKMPLWVTSCNLWAMTSLSRKRPFWSKALKMLTRTPFLLNPTK